MVLHKVEHEPEVNDLKRMQSLVVDAYAPYSPKAALKSHPFAEGLVRHARVAAPQQIILQSPSEPEFVRITEGSMTLETAEQEVYADVRLRAAYTRLVGSPRLELHLMLEEVQFGVTQSFNNPHTRGHFVYSIEIKVFPSENWAHHCIQTGAKPDETYNLQRRASLKITERLSILSLPKLSEESEETDAPSDLVKHRWLPAVFDPQTSEKAVEWTWKMATWDDGQPFQVENPTNCSDSTVIPDLPFANPEVIRVRNLEDINEATWEVPLDVVKSLNGRLDWSFEIRIFTACLQQKQVMVGDDVVTYRKKAERVVSDSRARRPEATPSSFRPLHD